ncbi:MAG: biotin transporter BioY [Methanocorpusculum sp.]|nr:biotin transporter BioY [Methanocorpusculum sp.]
MFGDAKRSKILIYSAVFTALIAAGGWISVPLFAVPFTLQTLFVLLAAVVMKKYAMIPAALYVLLGTAGLPLFHNGTSGIGIILGPTGGFLIGFIFMALAAGLFFERGKISSDVIGLITATAVSYVFGVSWFMISSGANLTAALISCVVPFLIGDIIKSAVTETVCLRLRKTKGETAD